ncbi:diacylglycerol kinase [Geothrix fuzhouensis]|uniref:diacylglycerol kinase n=1 Tax=Geothrix fuzhouensis TaxID=2966451 RepID=UPI002148E993|nr:diacylglycerol kinase [Geothrix fuzhouensis]
MKNQSFPKRLSYSLQGIRTAWRQEASFRFQSLMALGVVAVLIGMRPAAIWWALLLMNCGLVLAAELFNTALEHALDHLHPEIHPAIKVSKDCAAGAVLIFSLSAAGTFLAFLWSMFVRTSWPR